MLTRALTTVRVDRLVLMTGVVTWLLCFGYQLVFYWFYQLNGSYLIHHYDTVLSYYSGVIGDGVIVPVVNIVVVMLLREVKVKVISTRVAIAVGLGLVLTVLAHWAQANFDLTNWSMPTPYHWSLVGRFHFGFMWAESSLLIFTFIETVTSSNKLRRARPALLYSLAWLGLAAFAATFLADYLKVLGL